MRAFCAIYRLRETVHLSFRWGSSIDLFYKYHNFPKPKNFNSHYRFDRRVLYLQKHFAFIPTFFRPQSQDALILRIRGSAIVLVFDCYLSYFLFGHSSVRLISPFFYSVFDCQYQDTLSLSPYIRCVSS